MKYKKIIEAKFINRPNRFIEYGKMQRNPCARCKGVS